MSVVIDRTHSTCVFTLPAGTLQVDLPKVVIINSDPSGLSQALVGEEKIAVTEEQAEELISAGAIDQREMLHATTDGSPI